MKAKPGQSTALRWGAPLLALATLGLAAGGCAPVFADAKVDAASPAAVQVEAAAAANRTWPQFAEIPAIPSDLRGPRAWSRAVADVEQAGAALERETAPDTWTLNGTEAFAARAQSAVAGQPDAPTASDAEAFARSIRERATPPPPAR